ncbi:hypothetical protein B834_159 [Enterococcus mundtii 1A]|nr:hypothetical protein [Enterococcus mundtii 1A]
MIASSGLKIKVILEKIKIVIPVKLSKTSVANNLERFKKVIVEILRFLAFYRLGDV